MTWSILAGDVARVCRSLPRGYFDAAFGDPPYGLTSGTGATTGFMGKEWDASVPEVGAWSEIRRVVRPGGRLLAFGGTRTHHRLSEALEGAGWDLGEVRAWIHGQGFPKSHDVSKAIDAFLGAEREVVGFNPNSRPNSKVRGGAGFDRDLDRGKESAGVQAVTVPSSPEAREFEGFGTALKPSWEPIVSASNGLGRPPIGVPFLYCAKPSSAERNAGLDARNPHPTVKAIALARWLAGSLLPGARLLVPYSGSGSEMIGALLAGWPEVVGIEADPSYVAIAERRLRHWVDAPLGRAWFEEDERWTDSDSRT